MWGSGRSVAVINVVSYNEVVRAVRLVMECGLRVREGGTWEVRGRALLGGGWAWVQGM